MFPFPLSDQDHGLSRRLSWTSLLKSLLKTKGAAQIREKPPMGNKEFELFITDTVEASVMSPILEDCHPPILDLGVKPSALFGPNILIIAIK